ASPAFDCRDQLPGKIDCVGEAGVKAESAGWRILMRGIAADEDAAVAIMLGDALAPLPLHHGEHLIGHVVAADEATHIAIGIESRIGLQHRQAPELFAVDADDLAPSSSRIGEAEEARPALVVNLHDRRRAEEHVDAVRDEAETFIAE